MKGGIGIKVVTLLIIVAVHHAFAQENIGPNKTIPIIIKEKEEVTSKEKLPRMLRRAQTCGCSNVIRGEDIEQALKKLQKNQGGEP